MSKKYCRCFLCFYFYAFLTVGSNIGFANGSSDNESFKVFDDTGKRIINRENWVVLNRQMDVPEFYPIDHEINQLLSRWNIKGAAIGIAKGGNIVYAKGYGYTDVERKVKTQPDHLFRLASVSKLITATAIFQLIEQGKFSLDSPVFGENGILNDSLYTNQIIDNRVKNITVRHLLNHTGGWVKTNDLDVAWLPDHQLNKFLPGPYNLKTKLIAYTLSKGLGMDPGLKSVYSNVGYIILGEVVERTSGLDFYGFVRENIFAPLQISDIFPGRSFMDERYPDESIYYDVRGAKLRTSVFEEMGMVPGPYGSANIELLGPSGGMVGSVRELLKFSLAIDGFDDVPDILSKESIEEMTMKIPGITPLGWAGVADEYWWRTGTLSGTSALMVRKNDGVSYVILVNTSTTMRNQFSNELRRAMEIGLAKVEFWPNHKTIFPNFTYYKAKPTQLPTIEIEKLREKGLLLPNLARD